MITKPYLADSRQPKWWMQQPEMYRQLGLRPNQHLPAEGMSPRSIQGVEVFVLSKAEARDLGHFHRVRTICPVCSRDIPFGRLHQHAKTHKE